MSVAGGFDQAWNRGLAIGCQSVQIFTRNNRQWRSANFDRKAAVAFARRTTELKLPAFAHASYLINLGAPEARTVRRSLAALSDELKFAEWLGLPGLILHPGCHLGAGEKAGIRRIAANLAAVVKNSPTRKVRVILETMAGQGTCVGHRFEHLAEICERAEISSRLGFCFDTCHVFAAGYDISRARGLASTFREFDRYLGLDKLMVFHFNDSKTGLGSRVDRHQHIGKGHIGLEAFREILRTRAFGKIPKILETPKGEQGRQDITNLKILRNLI
jgi:deoxyribonuclease-4